MAREKLVEDLKWRKFPVLDDGFVCLVDMMGSDAAVVRAARVSYGKDKRIAETHKCPQCGRVGRWRSGQEFDGERYCNEHGPYTPESTTALLEMEAEDRTLLRYLMRHRHTTPFEMAEVVLLIRCPMDCWRQWIRHRTASVNEYSTRYAPAIDGAQRTDPGEWRLQSTNNKQGSGGYLANGEEPRDWTIAKELSEEEAKFHEEARRVYERRLAVGVAKEQARKDLPLSTWTEAYWKIDLHNLIHFLGLRMDSHAQKEIRDYATTIGEQIVKPLFPVVWEAFQDYHPHMGGMSLSRLDIEVIQTLHRAATKDALEDLKEGERQGATRREMGEVAQIYLPPYPEHFFLDHHGIEEWKTKRCRERDECLAKLQRMGIIGEV